MKAAVTLSCPNCGFTSPVSNGQLLFACPGSKKGGQHILQKKLNHPVPIHGETNPYLRFREFFFSYHAAKYLDVDYNQTVLEIDSRFKKLFGKGLSVTPLTKYQPSSRLSGSLWVKDETDQLTGSHKIRHVVGSLIYQAIHKNTIKDKKLSIYSCGNAALAAAAAAKAGGRAIEVFLPDHVHPLIEKSLASLGASTVICPRRAGETGDPSYNAFKTSLTRGSLPFSCSGPDNWSNIEGGQTLFLEITSQLQSRNMPDNVFIQVGGGALASSGIQSLKEMLFCGQIDRLPRIFAIQTESCFPLARAYFAIYRQIAQQFNHRICLRSTSPSDILQYTQEHVDEITAVTSEIAVVFDHSTVQAILTNSLKQPSLAKPWPSIPRSIAHGILDDVTYDWYAVIRGLLETGGWPVLVSETDLKEANQFARHLTGLPVDHTGSSGLAGLLKLSQKAALTRNLVVFTGRDRNEHR